MKGWWRWLALVLWPALATAHVGSPNVYCQGMAGPYPVHVSIRPPASLPGPAQVDVQAEGGASKVTVRGVFWDARDHAAPPAVEAEPTGTGELFHTLLWLLRRGAYDIQISVDGAHGAGVLSVPLSSAATQRPAMPRGLGAWLCLLGTLLLAGALWIARRASPRETQAPVAVVALVLAAGLVAGGWRWRTMDRAFEETALDRPRPMVAAIRTEGTLRLLRLSQASDVATDWDTLLADHGKLMHLFAIRETEPAVFAHLHPVRRDARAFENVLPPLPAGDYQLYGEITLANGLSQTLIAPLAVPAPLGPELPPQADAAVVNEVWCRAPTAPRGDAAQPYALDVDDSWHIGSPAPATPGNLTQVAELPGGMKMVFENANGLVVNREATLRFAVYAADGGKVPLQHYIGMLGHAAVRRADGSVFTHLHPAGTFSMGAQALFAGNPPPATPPPGTNTVTFPYAFPRDGLYRLWMQVRVAGRIQTALFEALVQRDR